MNKNSDGLGIAYENELVWTKAYRSLFKYGPVTSYCYIDHPMQACA